MLNESVVERALMIRRLALKNVGPAASFALDFAPRLNLLTGDNGLGKSFALDVAWWALTRQWPHDVNEQTPAGFMAIPRDPARAASISFDIEAKTTSKKQESSFDRETRTWKRDVGRPPNPGLVIYAQADGGFAAWDPARNYGKTASADRVDAFVFSSSQVWNGLEDKGRVVCQGLLRDWASWQRENGATFKKLREVLREMSPDGESLTPGHLTRIDLTATDHPTIRVGYGLEVPLVHASAGMRRIIALVYLLVWSWTEHQQASRLLGRAPSNTVTFLIDEVEAHLHPRWQRRVVPALVKLVHELNQSADVQLLVASHSPLVMASVETVFDPARDKWFDLDLVQGAVVVTEREFRQLGSAERWLLSEAFDLKATGDPRVEELIDSLEDDLKKGDLSPGAAKKWDSNLRKMLAEDHPFWSRWRALAQARGWVL